MIQREVVMRMNRMGRRSFVAAFIVYFSIPSEDNVQLSPASEAHPSVSTGNRFITSPIPLKCEYHDPPPDVSYDGNKSVFCKILRGEIPSRTFRETTSLLAFQDRTPRAPLHALIIPKKYIKSVFELGSDDIPLLEDMHEMAMDLIQSSFPDAARNNDFLLRYHVPPFNSVDHIHLHVLAPASQMTWPFRYGKYRADTRWCTDQDEVINRLKEGKKAVPYQSSSCWW